MKAEKTETKTVHVNVVYKDHVDTLTVTEKEFAEKYADYKITEESADESGNRTVIFKGK